MPFDGKEVKVAPEVIILDKMIDRLKDPKHWCKRTFQYENAVCLFGALRKADGKSPVPDYFHTDSMHGLTEESINVHSKMGELIYGETMLPCAYSITHEICNFNNIATHEEVIDLLIKTREAFL